MHLKGRERSIIMSELSVYNTEVEVLCTHEFTSKVSFSDNGRSITAGLELVAHGGYLDLQALHSAQHLTTLIRKQGAMFHV